MTGINNTMDRITNDRLCDILKFLPYRNAFQACSVCKRFNLVINQDHFWKDIDLTSIFTNLRIIDKEFYRKYVNLNALNIDLEQFHVINKVKAIPILHKMLSSIPVVNGTGITLLTIPPHFHNAQLQDLKKADELSKNFLVTEIPNFDLKIHGNKLCESYTVAITNSIIENTAKKSTDEQQEILAQYSCRPPNLTEAALLLYLSTNKKDPNWVFIDELGLDIDRTPSTYTQLTVIEKEQNVCTYNIGSYSVYQDDFLERNYIGYGSGYVSTTYLGVAAVKEIP